jgi:hypothetical protein
MVFFIFKKSRLLKALSAVLGPYSTVDRSNALMSQRFFVENKLTVA